MLESMRIENEMKHKAKLEAYERELENALKIIEQEDLIYQKNRMELARNTRKIIEEQEKDIRDNLKRLDDHFGKLEASYGKIVSCCNPDMTQIIEQSNKQLEELKVLKNSSRLSIDGMKSVCSKLEQLCNALINKNKEFEAQAKINQKKAEEAQAAAKAQAEAVQAEAAQQAAAAAAAAVAAPQPLDLPESRPNFQTQTEFTYNELMQYLANKQNLTGQLSTSKELEAMRFALKLAVNNPINHLNEQNKSSLIEGFQNLFKLLSGQRVETNKGSVSINDHPEAPDWVQLRVAEKLIVSLIFDFSSLYFSNDNNFQDVCDKKHKTVFFIAALTVALAQKFPGFGEIFLAKLFKECPFLLPHKPLRIQGQSDADFLASWGYKETDQNINGDAHYQGRTSNFAGLLAAIWITYSRRDETAPHPFAIDNCWKFFGNLFNNPPSPMYLHLIDKILEVAGSTMHATYRNHFLKLMILLKGQYLPSVQRYVDDHTQAPFNRLMSSTMLVELRFPPPEGKLTPNYW